MSTYHAPGVYSNIVSSGNKPIESVGSSTAAFIGQTSTGPVDKAMLVSSWAQYQKLFGGLAEGGYLAHSVYGYFLNGGSRAFINNIGPAKEGQTAEEVAAAIKGEDKGPGRRTGLNAFKGIDEIALVAAPGFTSGMVHQMLSDHAAECGDRMAILDGIDDLGEAQLHEFPRIGDSKDAALYWPWIQVFDESTKKMAYVPPSGHVMGVIARVDSERGVHKAAANETIRGALGLKYSLTRNEQALLNPRGVNLIRDFDDMGIRVYGARTLSGDPEWKYLNVRRLFQVAKQSITKGTEWVVFEPNNEQLWGGIARNIRAYLKTLFAQGALKGKTPEEAFYVRCDASTNPPENIDLGIVTIEIGIAPVKPAEFIQINIQQKLETEQTN
ncbi:phage tail sheath subtilisin-like domain-containing protein [bacterium]|nr:phage tail sheath subtilisin-like domain-containing protein [bacterium]